MKFSIDFSFRYVVLGVYFDRNLTITRIYPLPFVRLSIVWPL